MKTDIRPIYGERSRSLFDLASGQLTFAPRRSYKRLHERAAFRATVCCALSSRIRIQILEHMKGPRIRARD